MLDRKSDDQLTNSILNALIRKLHTAITDISGEDTQYYDTEVFIWNRDPDYPTLTINYNVDKTRPAHYDFIQLWWNGKFSEEEMEVYSNISVDAKNNLQFFVEVEQIIVKEIEELYKNNPIVPRQLSEEDIADVDGDLISEEV